MSQKIDFFGHNMSELKPDSRQLTLASISIDSSCNLRCSHCYSSSRNLEGDIQLSEEVWENVIHQISGLGCYILNFTGGEPVLFLDKVLRLGEFAHSLGIQTGLVTNGTLITQKVANRIRDTGFTVTVSLDGAKESHDRTRGKGTFSKAIEGIRTLLRNDVKVSILSTISTINLDEIQFLVKLSKELKVRQLILNSIKPMGRATGVYPSIGLRKKHLMQFYEKVISHAIGFMNGKRDLFVWTLCQPLMYPYIKTYYESQYEEILRLFPPVYCRTGRYRLWISNRGDVRPCAFLPINIGNVQSESLETIWKKSQMLKLISQRKFLGKCGKCEFKWICGGCRATAFFAENSALQSDPNCFINLSEDNKLR